MKAPTKAELIAALKDLVLRCDGPDGVRADGSNIETAQQHAVLARVGRKGAL